MSGDDKFVDEMIPYVEFADNANERTPCVLVLDCSGSMRGEPIKQLNAGLKALEKELKEDIDASSRVQLLIIKAFGKDEAVISSDWIDAMNFTAPTMEAGGLTPLGKAMELALQKIEEQKCLYDSCGITSKRPWIFLISDGEPTDYDWEIIAEKCRYAQKNKKSGGSCRGNAGSQFGKAGKIFADGAETADRFEIHRIFPLAEPQCLLYLQSSAEHSRFVRGYRGLG